MQKNAKGRQGGRGPGQAPAVKNRTQAPGDRAQGPAGARGAQAPARARQGGGAARRAQGAREKRRLLRNRAIVGAVAALLLGGLVFLAFRLLAAPQEEHYWDIALHPLDVLSTEAMAYEEPRTGLYLDSMERIAGYYIEDGSDEIRSDIFAVTVANPTERTLEYGVLSLTDGRESYTFNISTLLPGAKLRVMEAGKSAYPENAPSLQAEFETVAWFSAEPSLHPELFTVEGSDYAIRVTNKSGEDITGPIYVYYKSYVGGVYVGGITYRAGILDGLKAGESYSSYASHYTGAGSQVLFLTYVP